MTKLAVKPRNMIKLILLGMILIGVATSYHYYSYSMWDNNSVVEASAGSMKSDAHVIVKTDNTKGIVSGSNEAPLPTSRTAANKPSVIVATATLPQTSDDRGQALLLTFTGMIGIASATVLLNSRRVKVTI